MNMDDPRSSCTTQLRAIGMTANSKSRHLFLSPAALLGVVLPPIGEQRLQFLMRHLLIQQNKITTL